MKRWIERKVSLLAVLGACALTAPPLVAQQEQPAPAPAAQAAIVIEQGKFRLHKFEQPIGEESYQITRSGDSLEVKSNFEFTDRGNKVPLAATLRARPDLTPELFEIQGKTSRISAINAAVEMKPDQARVRDGKEWKELPRPEQFFTIAGYAPVSIQMLLVRYWSAHGSPATLRTLPQGEVKIQSRGRDHVALDGKTVELDRYSVAGLIWGRETLWFDSGKQLIAAVTVDAEFDHFEAIREGFEPLLGEFISRAAADGMAALAELSKGLQGSRSGVLALVGGTLIDGTGKDPVPDAAVVIDHGRIVAAGPRARVKIPSGARLVDTRGKFVLPGLWDMHAHFEQVEWGPIYLAAGVTTVRDVGNEFEFITAVRDAIREGRGLGPRLLLAGIVDGDGPSALGIVRVNSPEQAREMVDRYHKAGFEQMKIYSSVKRDNLAAVAVEAHRLGMTVTGHVPEGMTTYDAIDASMDQINHIQYVAAIMYKPLPEGAKRIQRIEAEAAIDLDSPEARKAIEFLRAHGTVVDPTIALMELLYTVGADRPVASFEPGVEKVAPEMFAQLTSFGVSPEILPKTRSMFEKNLAIIGALHRAGIPVVAGTDQSVPGYSVYREIELYVQAGFTPMEAIQAATIVPARVMKLDKELGTVEAGKRADIIITDANPLESIHNLRTVKTVIAGGTLYDCAPLWQGVGFRP